MAAARRTPEHSAHHQGPNDDWWSWWKRLQPTVVSSRGRGALGGRGWENRFWGQEELGRMSEKGGEKKVLPGGWSEASCRAEKREGGLRVCMRVHA